MYICIHVIYRWLTVDVKWLDALAEKKEGDHLGDQPLDKQNGPVDSDESGEL
jgi:hypothetical protein